MFKKFVMEIVRIRFDNKLFLFIALLLVQFYSNDALAIKAYPSKVQYKLSDGSDVSILLRGDENFKWAVSDDGYTLLYNNDGKLVYAMQDSVNLVVPSPWQLTHNKERSEALSSFLQSTHKSLIPIASNKLKNAILCQQKARSVSAKEPVIGFRKALVILMNFKDVRFTKGKEDFDALFNRIGYADDNAKGSVRDYYMESSSGQLNLNCDIVGTYTANYNMSYYGGNGLKGGTDKNPEALFKEAIQAASNDVNFSDYDANRDGYVDNIHIIFAGYGEEAGASASAIWSHEQTINTDVIVQGIKINTYSCGPELRSNSGNGITRIGVHCHELGHALGAMDFYDTDDSVGGQFEGTGEWDLMAAGSWNEEGKSPSNLNPYIRVYTFGWTKAKTQEGVATIYPVSQNNNPVLRMETSTPGEFFLLENRQQTGFDRALPGHGLIVYHINSKLTELETNDPNATNPQQCYPVCASSTYAVPSTSPTSYGNINSAGCPFPGTSKKSAFTNQSIPSARCWNGENSNIALTDIIENLSGEISLKIGINEPEITDGLVFAEDFETGIFSTYWEQTKTKGLDGWKICSESDYSGESVITSIGASLAKPINGLHYMYLKSSGMKIGSIVSDAILQNIGLTESKSGKLSFMYQNIPESKLTGSSVLKIYIQKSGQSDRILLATLSDDKKEWTPFVINLPTISETGKIIFEGSISAGDIYVDDIKIYDTSIPTQTLAQVFTPPLLKCWNYDSGIVAYTETAQPLEIYTIDGRLYQKIRIQPGENRIPLPRGFYIFSVKNYRCKGMVS